MKGVVTMRVGTMVWLVKTLLRMTLKKGGYDARTSNISIADVKSGKVDYATLMEFKAEKIS